MAWFSPTPVNDMANLITILDEPTSHQAATWIALTSTIATEQVVYVDGPWNVDLLGLTVLESREAMYSAASAADRLYIFGRRDRHVDDRLLSSYLGNRAGKIYWIHEDGIARYMPERSRETGAPDLLFIFPGPILPLNLGSHQRAFNLLRNLHACGHSIDVLIPANDQQEVVDAALRCFATNVHTYEYKRRHYPRWKLLARGADKLWRRMLGLPVALPDLYSERSFTKPVNSAAKLVRSLHEKHRYRTIVVSYAWMMRVVRHLTTWRSEFHLVCDTHDVQFVRNQSQNGRWGRLLASTRHERNLELRHLEGADTVIAISESDERVLSRHLKRAKVIRVTPGFDYARTSLTRRSRNAPVNFGFIGGKMEANVLALRQILKQWWPVIRQYSPDSKLYLAGTVSRQEDIERLTFFDESIVSLGFVDDLNAYYARFDVALNPVVVTGGLNFKSVEAVLYGKHLVTNTMGAACLGADFPCNVVESPTDLVPIIAEIERDNWADLSRRTAAQRNAASRFGNEFSSRQLSTRLGSAKAATADSTE